MKAFGADLWRELRETRLWPLAPVLLAALVAVPLFMRTPAAEPPARPAGVPPGARAPSAPALTVEVPAGSRLDVFDPRNPFRPRATPPAPAAPAQPAGQSGGQSGGASGASAGDGGSAPAPAASAAGSAAAGSTGSGSGSGSGGGTSTGRSGGEQKAYTYAVDLRFGRTGRERVRRGVQRLTMLPNADNPLLVFLGVDITGDTAVFLADSELSQSGEGRCKPSEDECSFVYLSLDKETDEHFFADEQGNEYSLRLLDIDQVEVKERGAFAGRRRPARAEASGAARQRRDRPVRPFTPWFAGDFRGPAPAR